MAATSLLVLTGLMLVVFYTTSPAAAAGCDTSQLILCLPAARTNPEPPSSQCCSLIHAITSDCLCAALQSSVAKIEGVDINTALQLPHKCGRALPEGTKCGDVTVPNCIECEADKRETMDDKSVHHHDDMEHSMDHEDLDLIDHGMEQTETQETAENESNHGMDHTMKRQTEDGLAH